MELALGASGYIANFLARYFRIGVYYREKAEEGSKVSTVKLEDAIVEAYVAILKYSAGVQEARDKSILSEL